MATKPTSYPVVAQSDVTLPNANTDNKVEPSVAIQDNGWDLGQQPAAQHHNWLFNNIFKWIQYFDEFQTGGDLQETVEDFVGGMLTGTQEGITVTYNDVSGELEFSVSDPTLTFGGAIVGSGQINNLGDTTFTLASNTSQNITRNFIDGYKCEVDSVSPTDTILVNGGVCADSDNTIAINLTTSMRKSLSATWAAGTGNGGLATGTVAADSYYAMFVIYNPTTGDVDIGFDTDTNATNLLATATGYTKYRRIGWVMTDASGNIIPFLQRGDKWSLNPSVTGGTSSVSTTAQLRTVNAPPETWVQGSVFVLMGDGTTGTRYLYVSSPLSTDMSAGSARFNAVAVEQGEHEVPGDGYFEVLTGSNSQIRLRASNTLTVIVSVHGYIDTRGRE